MNLFWYTPHRDNYRVRGIGIVNALEIVRAFPMQEDPINGLEKFAKWLNSFDIREVVGISEQSTSSESESERQLVILLFLKASFKTVSCL